MPPLSGRGSREGTIKDPRLLPGVERLFDADEFIVSKTDRKGRITYANQI
ncbi:MAG: hypothetical protein FD153_1054, partial [Rhodospirillaceae bacterium]